MIEGFSFVPNSEDKNGYGLNLIANSDFKVAQDERFDGKYNGKSFSRFNVYLSLILSNKRKYRFL